MLVKQRTLEITEKYRQLGHIPPDVEITQNIAHDCILKEISATLAHRKRLHAQVGHLTNEINQIERPTEQKVAPPSVPVATVKPHTVNNKPRKSREHRSRSQEWPDVPDVGKIEEQNPEILAQKILETGRQIEAGKITKPNVVVNGYPRESDRHADHHRHPKGAPPIHRAQPQRPGQPPPNVAHRQSPVKPQKPLNVVGKVQESPKVINFEDRLKSIITSVLNEDQEQRKASRPAQSHAYANGYVRSSAPHGAHGSHGSHGAHAYPRGSAAPAPGYARLPRELRRERYPPYERRDAPRHAAHAAHAAALEREAGGAAGPQPDYTQVSPSPAPRPRPPLSAADRVSACRCRRPSWRCGATCRRSG